jgi:hypothetical protein
MDYGLEKKREKELSAENFEKSSCFTVKKTHDTFPTSLLSSFKHLENTWSGVSVQLK